MKIFLLALLICLTTTSCNRAGSVDHTTAVRDDDPEMASAIQEARATLPEFIEILKSPKSNQDSFLIKGRFQAGNNIEHIWVADISFDGKSFHGVVANEPETIPNLEFKQPITVARKNVSDWMYIQDGKLFGGYTTRLLRSRLTDAERKAQDQQVPYKY